METTISTPVVNTVIFLDYLDHLENDRHTVVYIIEFEFYDTM